MKFTRLLLIFILSLFLNISLNAQSCTPPNEITINSWLPSNDIEVSWAPVSNANQYSIEILDVYTNVSIYSDVTPSNNYIIPAGIINNFNDVIIILGAECGGIWHYNTVDILGVPDVWIVYNKVCPEEGMALSPYHIRVHYPTPIYASNYHLYSNDCFCPGIKDIRHHYQHDPHRAPYPIVYRRFPEFANTLSRYPPFSHPRYTNDVRGYVRALFDFNEFERYFAFHCHDIEPEIVEYEDGSYSKKENELSISSLNLKVYPNPATTGFNIESDYQETVLVSMYNLIGEEIMQFELNGNSSSYVSLPVDLTGLYFLQLKTTDGTHLNTLPLQVK